MTWQAASFVMASVLASGCSCGSSDVRADASAGATDLPTPTAASRYGLADELSTRVLARIDEREITAEDFASEIENLRGDSRIRFNLPEHREELLDHMIDQQLLADEARRRGYATDPEVVHTRRAALISAVASEIRSEVELPEITEAGLRLRYEAEGSRWNKLATARIRFLRLPTRESAEHALRSLQHGDRHHRAHQFLDLAQGLPTTPMVQSQGEAGPFGRDGRQLGQATVAVSAEIAEAAFATEPGELVADVMLDGDSFVVFETLTISPATQISFGDARSRLLEEMRTDTESAAIEQLTLHGRHVTFDDAALRQVNDPREQ